MVQFISFLMLISLSAHADIFGFGSDSKFTSRIPQLTEKLKALDMQADPSYEDSFNQAVKEIENGVEVEKLYCAGEAGDTSGKVLPKEQKELCFRQLRKHYVESVNTIFEMKKKYLAMLHGRQVERLSEIHKKLQSDIEKNF